MPSCTSLKLEYYLKGQLELGFIGVLGHIGSEKQFEYVKLMIRKVVELTARNGKAQQRHATTLQESSCSFEAQPLNSMCIEVYQI